ncbi:hypothetical protein SAVIM338S_00931 [Streptomyces avidinii]
MHLPGGVIGRPVARWFRYVTAARKEEPEPELDEYADDIQSELVVRRVENPDAQDDGTAPDVDSAGQEPAVQARTRGLMDQGQM